jgi:two-component system cell cycle response regulator
MTDTSTILVVDDEQLGQETLLALLGPLNYQVVVAGNGADAIQQAQAILPDLILLDVMMPDMNGFDVCRRVRAMPKLAEVPIIMLTALDDRDSRLQGIEAGADDFISKPYNRVELRARVRTITRLNRYRRLLNERTKFEWAIERADEGYLLVESNGAIRYANPRARLFLNIDPAATSIGTFADLVKQQYQLQPHNTWAEWFAPTDRDDAAPRLLVRPAGQQSDMFMLHADVLAIAPDPEPCYLVRLRDITSTVINQHAVWSFQSLVQHKLRTSLAQLLGALRLIEGLNLVPAKDTLADLMNIVSSGASKLHTDIDDILRHTQLPDTIRSAEGQCRLAEVPAIVDELSADQESTEIKFSEAIAHAKEPLVLGISRHALRLILNELLENARKFHPQKRPAILIDAIRDGDQLHLHICDNGKSLAPDQLAQAWAPYYQGERYFTGQVPGMGLGLPIVASLMWSIGGACQISNRNPGPGIDVTLSMPIVESR